MKSIQLFVFILGVFSGYANSDKPSFFLESNPYQEIGTIDDHQIKGDNFVEVYRDHHEVEDGKFEFFKLFETQEDYFEEPKAEANDLPPFPVPIDRHFWVLFMVIGYLFWKYRAYGLFPKF